MTGKTNPRSELRALLRGGLALLLLLLPASGSAQSVEERLGELERTRAAYEEVARELERMRQRIEELESRLTKPPVEAELGLERRVRELEAREVASEDATRTIIGQALQSVGSNINESVALGGTLELLGGWERGFRNRSEGALSLNTFELDFEIQMNEWTLASAVVEYDDGSDASFLSTGGDELSVDRIKLDTAFLTLGDPTRFWPVARVGRMVVPFGISTGDPVADVLSVDDPITLEVFETREDAVYLGIAFPTPAPAPLTPVAIPAPVRPLLIAPALRRLSGALGYEPWPAPPAEPGYRTLSPAPAPFALGVWAYNGETESRTSNRDWVAGKHLGASASFRTRGGPCDALRGALLTFCPWSVELGFDYNRSIFDSLFLESTYRPFLGQIGFVPGTAASLKGRFGPLALVAEWNGAVQDATFTDDLGRAVRMAPRAWQVSLGYQLGFQPWVEQLGAQGTYLSVSYSQSRDLGGVMRLADGTAERIGFAPRRRVLVTLGEWILPGVRVAVEYAHVEDYARRRGGSGRRSNGLSTLLTYEW